MYIKNNLTLAPCSPVGSAEPRTGNATVITAAGETISDFYSLMQNIAHSVSDGHMSEKSSETDSAARGVCYLDLRALDLA